MSYHEGSRCVRFKQMELDEIRRCWSSHENNHCAHSMRNTKKRYYCYNGTTRKMLESLSWISMSYFFREWEKSIPLTNIKITLLKLHLFTLFQDYSQHYKSRYVFISTFQMQYYKKNNYTFKTSCITIQLYTKLIFLIKSQWVRRNLQR